MDSRFSISRDELYSVQMDVKQLHLVQSSHADRLNRLEKRQADDAALKSVWNSPFPSALGGTPQHGPLQMPSSEIFDDFEEQGQSLIGSLHLDAEDEPTRRGAASRANSVRFDESALQGSSCTQNGRQSGDFGPIRPGSGMGNLMERSLSHKSDGRHSSAGHSVHSHHSVASGRASSLGLDTNFATTGSDEDSPIGVPEPPPGFFVLGSVPSIVRCWLTANFAHDTLHYADICTGSQKSVLEYSLIKELGLVDAVHRDLDGAYRIRLAVYLAEATVAQASSRGASPAPQMPNLVTTFEVVGMEQAEGSDAKKSIRVFIGSETLREHSADILFSQNRMTLYGSERERLSVPFVRPEEKESYKNIRTLSFLPEKPKLNATARPFVFGESKQQQLPSGATNGMGAKETQSTGDTQELRSPTSEAAERSALEQGHSSMSDSGCESEKHPNQASGSEASYKDQDRQGEMHGDAQSDGPRRESTASGIWTSWRQASTVNGSDQKDSAPLSGYQPAGRGRAMKVLKPSKSSGSTSSARTGAAYEPPPPPRTSGEHRRKSQGPVAESTPTSTALRWKSERSSTSAADNKPAVTVTTTATRESRTVSLTSAPRTSANPVGGASAFSWMAQKPKTSTAAAE